MCKKFCFQEDIFMKYLRQFLLILLISFIGELLHEVLPLPVPASVYGFAILFIGLLSGVIKLAHVKDTGKLLIEIMPVMFIPAGVGLLESWPQLSPIGVLSLHEMNHSANRGACMQVCRRSYTVRDKETNVELEVDNQYIMSPKDLKTIHFMNKMLDAGVRVFKIEGRARGPEYVRTVVECYKEAIRSYLDDTFTDEKIARWDERLKTVFNRGFWDGYYLGQRLGEWTKNYGSAATERKIYVGKGIRYFSNIGVAEFLVEAAEVSVGDKLLITGPTTGAEFVTLDEARVDLKPVQTVKKGQHFSMKSVKIRPSDKLYKLVSVEELKKFKGLDVEKQRG